mmetsp:Transcript_17469/g.56656  ORF Transcript_17469/g.56656 Transcript_17469/m.56656 type:complete len:215 (-) Transcript_17469:86-730(-)
MTAEATAAAMRRAMMTCVSWMMKSMQSVMRGGLSSSFGPSSRRRFFASSLTMPLSLSEFRSLASKAMGASWTSMSAPTSSWVKVSRVSVLWAAMTMPALLSKRWRWRSFSTSSSTGGLPLTTSARASTTVAPWGGASSSSVNSRSPDCLPPSSAISSFFSSPSRVFSSGWSLPANHDDILPLLGDDDRADVSLFVVRDQCPSGKPRRVSRWNSR